MALSIIYHAEMRPRSQLVLPWARVMRIVARERVEEVRAAVARRAEARAQQAAAALEHSRLRAQRAQRLASLKARGPPVLGLGVLGFRGFLDWWQRARRLSSLETRSPR